MKKAFAFRKTFDFNQKLFWYPTHQSRALEQLRKGLNHIDLVIEVRDARIPLTSISSIDLQRKKLVVYNKRDLIDQDLFYVRKYLEEYKNEETMLTSSFNVKNLRKIIEHCKSICQADPIRYPYLSVVVVGCPNVGKSTLINGLRNLGAKLGKTTKVGEKAGVTTKIQTRVKINEEPKIYLVDTPGIFNPHFSTPVEGLKIALTGGTNDSLTPLINVVDYLLFRLNNSKLIETYPQVFGLTEPIDDVYHLVDHVCKEQNLYMNPKNRIVKLSSDPSALHIDEEKGCKHILSVYREGKLGPLVLDDLSKESLETYFNEVREQ
jgi:ribosome biogenesis GTPase A